MGEFLAIVACVIIGLSAYVGGLYQGSMQGRCYMQCKPAEFQFIDGKCFCKVDGQFLKPAECKK